MQSWQSCDNTTLNDNRWRATSYGSAFDDKMPFENLPFINVPGSLAHGEMYTNEQLWGLLDPSNRHLPYIYDQFTEWGTCAWDPFANSTLEDVTGGGDDDDGAGGSDYTPPPPVWNASTQPGGPANVSSPVLADDDGRGGSAAADDATVACSDLGEGACQTDSACAWTPSTSSCGFVNATAGETPSGDDDGRGDDLIWRPAADDDGASACSLLGKGACQTSSTCKWTEATQTCAKPDEGKGSPSPTPGPDSSLACAALGKGRCQESASCSWSEAGDSCSSSPGSPTEQPRTPQGHTSTPASFGSTLRARRRAPVCG